MLNLPIGYSIPDPYSDFNISVRKNAQMAGKLTKNTNRDNIHRTTAASAPGSEPGSAAGAAVAGIFASARRPAQPPPQGLTEIPGENQAPQHIVLAPEPEAVKAHEPGAGEKEIRRLIVPSAPA